MRRKKIHIELSALEHAEKLLSHGGRSTIVCFSGRVVSFANLLPPEQVRASTIPCRRRPKRTPCPGRLEVARAAEAEEVHWYCPVCRDAGVITGWRGTRWDLTVHLQSGHVVSLLQHQAKRHKAAGATHTHAQVIELSAELVSGPIDIQHPVRRRLRLSGDKTLHDLHGLLRAAFEWRQDEPYDFMFGAPYERGARRFTGGLEPPDEAAKVLSETRVVTLSNLELTEGQVFGYLFDFGEEWVHRITVLSNTEVVGYNARPRVVQREGEPLPQHPDCDELWEHEGAWTELDDDYPMTGLYGPYVADQSPDPDRWSTIDEIEQLLLVMEAHARGLPPGHAAIHAADSPQSPCLHAMIHCLAESQLANGNASCHAALDALLRGGTTRHEAIHELGERLIRTLLRKRLSGSATTMKKAEKKQRPKLRTKLRI